MLFHGKTPMAQSCWNYWSKSSNFTTIGLRHGICPVKLHHITHEQLLYLIKLLLFTKSKFSAIFSRHFIPYLCFLSLPLFCHKPEFFVLFMQVLSLASIIVVVFIKAEILLILFQIHFMVTLHVAGIAKKTCPPSLKSNYTMI